MRYSRLILVTSVVLVLASFGHTQSFSQSSFSTASMPSQMKSADLNDDGFPDLILISDAAIGSDRLVVHLNQGSGKFGPSLTFATQLSNVSEFEVVDANRDGKDDLVYVGQAKLGFLFGRGDGTFGAPHLYPATSDPLNSLGVCDLNRDGRTDYISSAGTKLEILFGKSDGSVTPVQTYSLVDRVTNAEAGDLDGDGNCDIAFVIHGPMEDGAEEYLYSEIQVWYGNGAGGFSQKQVIDAKLPYFSGFKIFDLNRDGRRDIVGIYHFCGGYSCDQTSPFVYLSLANRAFRKSFYPIYPNRGLPTTFSTAGPAYGDFNNDGTTDLAAFGFSEDVPTMVNVYPLARDATFGVASYIPTGQREGPPFSMSADIASGDFNRDGKVDLAVAIAERQIIKVLLNNGPTTPRCTKDPAEYSQHICSPYGFTLNSPVRVTSAANSPDPLTSSAIYLNGVKSYVVRGGTIDTNINLTEGKYRLTVKSWDSKGTAQAGTVYFEVFKCPLSAPLTINLCTIAEGGTYTAPLTIVASANSPARIEAWELDVDGSTVSLDPSPLGRRTISPAPGTHRITLRAWDTRGVQMSKTVTITVK